jgi:hypothetical protein
MKLLSLVAVVAIVYFAYGKRLAPGNDSVGGAMQEFDKTVPAAKANSPAKPHTAATSAARPQTAAPGTSNLRRPIDRTRAVLEQVKQRNGNGEF